MAEGLDLEAMRFAVRRGRIEWQRHALERMVKRVILRQEIKQVLLKGELIEDYPEDYPFPSALFSGGTKERPLHVVAAWDAIQIMVFIITVYEPDLDHFEPDLRTRRKR
jgi:hypothetical protein